MERAVVQVVDAMRYEPEGSRFDSRWSHWNFSLTYSCRPQYALDFTQPGTEMSARNISWEVKMADTWD